MPRDNSDYNRLRDSAPKEVRLGIMELRKRALNNPITKEQSLDPLWLMNNIENHGMVAGPYTLIFSVEKHDDSIYWHLSISHKDRYPTWDELMMFRSFVFNDDMEVIMIMPKVDEYVNLHQRCFHLWHNTKSNIIRN